MFELLWPLIIVVGSNIVYNICAKSTPSNVNTFATLTITYLVAALVTFLIFIYMVKPEHAITELSKINWTSIVLGIAIVGLEFGYIYMYRVGWELSIGSLVANICLACSLLVIGVLLYKEHIGIIQILGIIVCCAGLILVTSNY